MTTYTADKLKEVLKEKVSEIWLESISQILSTIEFDAEQTALSQTELASICPAAMPFNQFKDAYVHLQSGEVFADLSVDTDFFEAADEAASQEHPEKS